LAVRDEHQDQGLGTELITYITYLAQRKGLLGFTAEVLVGNDSVFRLFDRMGFDVHKRNESGIYEMKLLFKDIDQN
jgi:ribosomal protein S18 acetylase RimI-like enzyme